MVSIFQYTKRLEQVGFSRKQAETQLEIIGEMFTENTATKQDLVVLEGAMKKDLLVLETSIRTDMQTMEASLRTDMQTLEVSLRTEMQTIRTDMHQLKNQLMVMFGAFFTFGFTAMTVLLKFWLIK